MTDVATEPKTRTITYRVFLFNTGRTDQTWNELPPLIREDVEWFYPSAQDLGEKYGQGHFMYFEAGEESGWRPVKFMRVGIEPSYFEETGDESDEVPA